MNEFSRHDSSGSLDRITSFSTPGDGTPTDFLAQPGHVNALIEEMNHAFTVVDKNNTGILTNQQIGELVENQNLHGGDAAVAAAFYRINHEIQVGNIDLGIPANPNGLTREELNIVEDRAQHGYPFGPDQSAINTTNPTLWAQTQFEMAGVPTNQRLYLNDVDLGMQSTMGDAQSRQSANFLKQHFADATGQSGHLPAEGATFDDLTKYAKQVRDQGSPFWDLNDILIKHGSVMTETMPTSLYGYGNDVTRSVTSNAIEQGVAGDCFFESPLGGVSDRHPEKVVQMLRANLDGTYTATMSDHGEKYTVTKPTEAERTLFNKGGSEGDWATVAEKAYGLWTNDKFHAGGTQKQGEVPQQYISYGGMPQQALGLMTNTDATRTTLSTYSDASLANRLSSDFSSNKVVIVDRQPVQFKNDHLVDLPMGHAYEVTSFTPLGIDGGIVGIKNPWNTNSSPYGGRFTMTLHQFKTSFNDMFEEGDNKSAEATFGGV